MGQGKMPKFFFILVCKILHQMADHDKWKSLTNKILNKTTKHRGKLHLEWFVSNLFIKCSTISLFLFQFDHWKHNSFSLQYSEFLWGIYIYNITEKRWANTTWIKNAIIYVYTIGLYFWFYNNDFSININGPHLKLDLQTACYNQFCCFFIFPTIFLCRRMIFAIITSCILIKMTHSSINKLYTLIVTILTDRRVGRFQKFKW